MCSFGLPRPAPPRSESEGGSRGARAMVMPACLEPGDFSWFCGGSPRDDVERKGCGAVCGRWWASRVPPVPLPDVFASPARRVRPPPARPRLRRSRDADMPCVSRCALSLVLRRGGVASLPPSPAAFPRLGTTGDLFPLLGAGDPGLAGSTSLSGACGLWGTTVGRPRRVAGRVGAHSRSRVFGGGGGVGSLPC